MTKKCGVKCKNTKKTSQTTKNKIENETKKTNCNELEKKVKELQSKLNDANQIATKAQQDYINLKMDFEHLRERMEQTQKDGKLDAIINIVSKFLPFVETLRKSTENIPDDEKENNLAKGVIMTYNNFLKTLEDLSIFQIDAIGLEPDTNLHEPVSMQPVEDKKMKGKIIMEFEKGFIYKKDGIEKVIKSSKVVIGQ